MRSERFEAELKAVVDYRQTNKPAVWSVWVQKTK